jgi:hypothetical protein
VHVLTVGESSECIRILAQMSRTLGRRAGEHEILQQTAILRHAIPPNECGEPRVSE